MKDASDYLAYIKALIVVNPHVLHWSVIREEAQGDMGLLRYKLTLDGGLLEMFELFQIVDEKVKNLKYSFHLQDKSGNLLKRWDNAEHHPEISTSPHHVHEGSEKNIQPHKQMNAQELLTLLAAEQPE